jgi:pSer/pThr/pTyr-binding forkhead associated (FHA) protein
MLLRDCSGVAANKWFGSGQATLSRPANVEEEMASLQIRVGDAQVWHYSLEKEQTILGRNADCDVVIPSLCASRRHARIIRVGDQFYVEDMDTPGGTRVNGSKISNQIKGRKVLRRGDEIWFGGGVVVQFQE